jgi:hypothetical protein
MPDSQDQSTSERLARDLGAAGAPAAMITRAREGYYDDYRSPVAFPQIQLISDLHAAGLVPLCVRAARGEWDGTRAEADAWLRSPEGAEALREFLGDHGCSQWASRDV